METLYLGHTSRGLLLFGGPEDLSEQDPDGHQNYTPKHKPTQILVEEEVGEKRCHQRRERGESRDARHGHQAKSRKQAVDSENAGKDPAGKQGQDGMPVGVEQRRPASQGSPSHQSDQHTGGELQEDRGRLMRASELAVAP